MAGKSRPPDRRGRILEALRLRGPMTAQELAALLGGRPVAMRVHLRHLATAGLVSFDEEHRAMGRPVRRFKLTPAADGHFTKHYEILASHLASSVVSQFGEPALEKILKAWRDDLARHLDRSLPPGPDRRLAALAEHQSKMGFMAAVEKDGQERALVERNCPIAAVAALHPRICDHEAALYRRVLGREVELASCQARGDGLCRFQIGPPKSA